MSAQSGRLQHALKHLREQWDIAQDTWDDPASRDFEKNHIDPAGTERPRTRSSAWKSCPRSWGRSGLSARRTDGSTGQALRQHATDATGRRSVDEPGPVRRSELNHGSWNHA